MTIDNPQLPAIPSKWIALIKSRKFWAAVVGLGLVIFRAYQPDFPIDDEQLGKIILILIAYILGTALEDSALLSSVARSTKDASQSHGYAAR